jgi:hypothetical protein
VLKCCQKKTELQTPKNDPLGNVVEDDVEDAFSVHAYVSKLHLTNLEKQHEA